MKDSTDIINETLGVVEEVTNPVVKKEPVVVPVGNDDIDKDYAYQRQNFYSLVERGQDAIDGILDLARESEHPRTYEVAGQLIKTVAEVTEKLGDLQEKIDPYLAPIYDSLRIMLSENKLAKLLKQKIIEVVPLAYMRGRTMDSSFMILDEAQNATVMQMKMFLTRL